MVLIFPHSPTKPSSICSHYGVEKETVFRQSVAHLKLLSQDLIYGMCLMCITLPSVKVVALCQDSLL